MVKFALYPPRFLCILLADVVVVEESRLRPSQATVLSARPLSSLAKLHFKPAATKLSLVFKQGEALHVELGSSWDVGECVGLVRLRLEGQGVHGTRTSVAKSRAVERAGKLVDLAKVNDCRESSP
jgi:hypothetical protein